MNDLRKKDLADIVIDNHRAAAVFEKYRLDYCFNGHRTLEEACSEKSMDIMKVISDLENEVSGSTSVNLPFKELPLSVLTDYIHHTHHDYIRKESPQLVEYLQKIVTEYGDKNPKLIKVLAAFNALREELELHMQKEERVLFPRINEMDKNKYRQGNSRVNIAYLQSPITIMEQEHLHTGELMEEIHLLTQEFSIAEDSENYRLAMESLQAFESDLHQHIHLENNILFPAAIEMFRKTEQASLN